MRETTRFYKRYAYRITVVCLLFSLVFGQGFVMANDSLPLVDEPISLVSELRVSEGTVLKQYNKMVQGNANKIFVTEIDLNNPYVKIAPIYGKEGKIDKQPLTSMADENGAVVAINANFFHLTQRPAPFAMQYKDGELITSQSVLHDWMTFAITTDKTAQIGNLGFSGYILTDRGYTFPIFNLNKEVHNTHEGNSHENRLNLYNSRWKDTSLGTLNGMSGVVEVIIEQETVTDIRVDQPGVPIPENGYVLMGHGAAARFLLENTRIGERLQVFYQVTPDATSIDQAIGAHALLVDLGMPVAISPKTDFSGAKTSRARSAIGISQDGKKVYFIAVEKSATSNGVNLENLANIIAELGIWRAANLDGGGSTTLVSRMPGDDTVTLLNAIDGGFIRSVPDGIAVYNLAPPGKLAGIQLNSNTTNLLVGSKVTYTLKGYDEHVLPYNVYQHPVQWTSSNKAVGTFVDGSFIATGGGKTDIYGTVMGVSSNPLSIQVFGGNDIEKVEVSPSVLNILPNDASTLTVHVTTKSGVTFRASADNIKWTVEGIDGVMDGLTYRSGTNIGVGRLTGLIDGFTFTVPVHQGSVYNIHSYFDNVAAYYHSHYPSGNAGSFTRVDEKSGEPIFRGAASMKLTYQFTANTFDETGQSADPIEASYGNMTDPNLIFPADALGFGMWVYGDNSNYTLKAHVKDSGGKVHYVTLADRINWNGWKYVETRFASTMSKPLALTSLYVVDEPNALYQDRPLTGSIYFDEILSLRPYEPAFVDNATTIQPNSKDESTNVSLSFGFLDLHIPAQVMEKHATQYTVTPIATNEVRLPIVGYNSYAYGFQLDLKERKDVAFTTFSVAISAKGNQYFDLLVWSESKNEWNRIIGYPTADGALQFDLTGSGLYIPVRSVNRISFTDIADHWAKAAVVSMAQQGIIKGTSDTEYKPFNSLSRGEIATLLYRVIAAKEPQLATDLLVQSELNFVDEIPEWAAQGVITAVNLGVMNGVGQDTFAPTDPLTREQLATILVRSVQNLNISLPEGTEAAMILDQAEVSEWATAGVQFSVNYELFPLIEGKFAPKQKVNRGEAAYAIERLFNWIQEP